MSKGRVWPAEWRAYDDPVSGVRVRQLTRHKAHSHHLYFTNPGWYGGGRRLLVASDRENASNLFGLDLDTGEMRQLTAHAPDEEPNFLATTVNPTREEAYFGCGRRVTALDLETLEQRPLWEVPEGFRRSMLNTTADGRHVCLGIVEDLAGRFRLDLGHGYVGFRETFEAKPDCRIVRVPVDGGKAETVWQEACWIGHVNTSPTRADLLSFCHEGPWDRVDNRIWGLDLSTGRAWAVRPREGDESPGHEYWLADGETMAYHGRRPDGSSLMGRIRYDNSERLEFAFSEETGHTHSNDFSLVVGDAGSVVRMWRVRNGNLEGPRVLAEHRGSKHVQALHVHPRFTPDGSEVLYTADPQGYGNVYLAQVPASYESLPALGEAR